MHWAVSLKKNIHLNLDSNEIVYSNFFQRIRNFNWLSNEIILVRVMNSISMMRNGYIVNFITYFIYWFIQNSLPKRTCSKMMKFNFECCMSSLTLLTFYPFALLRNIFSFWLIRIKTTTATQIVVGLIV